MKVYDLQQFLRSLAQPLTSAGGKKVADDLERAAAGMELFKDMAIPEFADFLTRAEHFVRTGELPQSGRATRAAKPREPKVGSEQKVKDASQRVLALLERVSDDDFDFQAVDQEMLSLNKLTKSELEQVSRELDITRTFRTKKEVLKEIERKVKGRREMFDRTQFHNEPPAGMQDRDSDLGDNLIEDRAEELAERLDEAGVGERDER